MPVKIRSYVHLVHRISQAYEIYKDKGHADDQDKVIAKSLFILLKSLGRVNIIDDRVKIIAIHNCLESIFNNGTDDDICNTLTLAGYII